VTILTTVEAAERLGITPRRLRALIKSEKLPAEKFGTAYMINEKDLAKVRDRKPGRPKKLASKAKSK
jgi:excisionase family DNA binding protein